VIFLFSYVHFYTGPLVGIARSTTYLDVITWPTDWRVYTSECWTGNQPVPSLICMLTGYFAGV